MAFRKTKGVAPYIPISAEVVTRASLELWPGTKASGNDGWFIVPNCPECGKVRHFAFHPTIGYVCHKCGIRGGREALELLLRAHGASLPDNYVPEDLSFEETTPRPLWESQRGLCEVDLPKEWEPCTAQTLPRYFVERGYPGSLLLALGFGYCQVGRYGGRIIVPLETEGDRAFLAYLARRAEGNERKVLYPTGCQISRFLFPYRFVAEFPWAMPPILVICEGVTDALSIIAHSMTIGLGLPLALLGKNMSDRQADLIFSLAKKIDAEIVVCLDADTVTRGDQIRAATKLRNRGASKVSVMDLLGKSRSPEIQDPDLRRLAMQAPWNIDPGVIRNPYDWKTVLDRRSSIEEACFW